MRPSPARVNFSTIFVPSIASQVGLRVFACWHHNPLVNSITGLCKILCCCMTSCNECHAHMLMSHCMLGGYTVLHLYWIGFLHIHSYICGRVTYTCMCCQPDLILNHTL